MTGYERVRDALQDHGIRGGYGSSFTAACPGPLHDRGDRNPSLSVGEGDDGRALVYCHVGCSLEDIVDALGLGMADLFTDHADRVVVAQYIYTDKDDNPVFRVNRTSDKAFFQERYEDGEWKVGLAGVESRPLYRLPDVLSATSTVCVVEGEKDADTLRMLGETATCYMGGAGKWDGDATEALRGKDVIIVRDNDEPGTKHALMVEEALTGVARSVEVYTPTYGKDFTDAWKHGVKPYIVPLAGSLALEEFDRLDWETYEVTDTDWLYKPYIPKGGRTLVFGKAASLKSLWAMWIASRVAKEGGKVAYFSLEMRPSDAVSRLKKFRPPPENFLLLRNLRLGHDGHLQLLIKAIKGYDLIVVDSWNASTPGRKMTDDDVAALDSGFFLPLIEGTGATLLLLDNTGHDAISDGSKVKMEHARGSSAKGDKMDTTIWLDRPYEDNNYMTKVTVKKMRLDVPIPEPRIVVAPSECDPIEFFYVDEAGQPAASAWTGETWGGSESLEETPAAGGDEPFDSVTADASAPLSFAEQLAIARIKDTFKVVEDDPV